MKLTAPAHSGSSVEGTYKNRLDSIRKAKIDLNWLIWPAPVEGTYKNQIS